MNGMTMLIYTTEQGGYFKGLVDGKGQITRFSEEEFEALKESRELKVSSFGDGPDTFVRPVLIALARIEDNFDFVLGTSREHTAEALVK